jgi:lipopolysaccharide transport protein LptA
VSAACALVAFGVIGSARALAANPDPKAPAPAASASAKAPEGEALGIEAEHLELDVDGRSAVLTGKVALRRGDLVLRAPRVEVRYDEAPRVTWAHASGGVVAEARGVHAEAPDLELDLGKQTLELRGGVRVTRGAGFLTAERASIQLATMKISMSGVKGVVPVGDVTR